MFAIAPRPLATTAGRSSAVVSTTAETFRPISARSAPGSASATGPSRAAPALLTRTSAAPMPVPAPVISAMPGPVVRRVFGSIADMAATLNFHINVNVKVKVDTVRTDRRKAATCGSESSPG
jgi:hypothetical protein